MHHFQTQRLKPPFRGIIITINPVFQVISSYKPTHPAAQKTSPVRRHMFWQRETMEAITIFKFGKPSISMGHLYHGYVK